MKVKQTRNRCRDDLSVSVKIRIHDDWEGRTVELCRRLEAAGAAYLTVHGRTKDQRAEAVNLEAIRAVKQASLFISWLIRTTELLKHACTYAVGDTPSRVSTHKFLASSIIDRPKTFFNWEFIDALLHFLALSAQRQQSDGSLNLNSLPVWLDSRSDGLKKNDLLAF